MLTNHIGTDSQDLSCRPTAAGVPVLDGTLSGLKAIRHAMSYRDFIARPAPDLPTAPDASVTRKWRERLERSESLSEAEGLAMLSDYGIPVVQHGTAGNLEEARKLADSIGYPVVLKTATEGILHKSDVGGVHVNIANEEALTDVYEDMAKRLGPDVLVAAMAPVDVELALGIIIDDQFGPIVMVAGGGVFIEIYKDRRLCLAPVNRAAATEMLDQLTIRPVLDGVRGRPALDKAAVIDAMMALSSLATDLGDLLAELDVNPLAVTPSGCFALDALAVSRAASEALQDTEVTTPQQRKKAMGDSFKALVLREVDGNVSAEIEDLDNDDLPEGDVLVKVDYSSLNYKDGMALTGKGNIIRSYPMVPGIDFAGSVLASDSEKFSPGDPVILTGWSVGERYWGGFTERQRTQSKWLVGRPAALESRDAMGIGTAGLTSMLCVMAIEDGGIRPEHGPIVVTGAAGGVGSVAVALLAGLGYEVTAVTGRADTHEYLKSLGASAFLTREEMTERGKPLESETWAGAIDTVGSKMLTKVLSQTRYRGVVAACGLAGGFDLPTTVMPFILRGVRLQGVDSVMAPVDLRERAWKRLASELDFDLLHSMMTEVPLSDLLNLAPKILAGQIRGRIVVNTHA
jgi:acrylyl-CoA reductase (NADPH)